GVLATPGFGGDLAFTTPNADHIPVFAVALSEIIAGSDGLWGLHEYSRRPQLYNAETRWLAFIPTPLHGFLREEADYEVLWQHFEPSDWSLVSARWAQTGLLKDGLVYKLYAAFTVVWTDFMVTKIPCDTPYWDQLRCTVIRAIDRLRLHPGQQPVVLAVAAHVQRLCLEILGRVVQEIWGCGREGFPTEDFRDQVLPVVGAYTNDATEAGNLHTIGIPVWLQQEVTSKLRVWEVVLPTALPFFWSTTPGFPRLVLATPDLSGALNTNLQWKAAMEEQARQQLLSLRLTDMEGAPSSCSTTADLSTRENALALPHTLQQSGPRPFNRKAFTKPPAADKSTWKPPPTRKFYCSLTVQMSPSWMAVLDAHQMVGQPSVASTWFFPPPTLVDTLAGEGVSPSTEKQAHMLLQYLVVRDFCRSRIFNCDKSISRPLAKEEWRDVLHGSYDTVLSKEEPQVPLEKTSKKQRRAMKRVHTREEAVRTFAILGGQPSFKQDARPVFQGRRVTLDMLKTHRGIRFEILWEIYETNWRCELLALDSYLLKSSEWPTVEQWTREAVISRVWGSDSTSGLNLLPSSRAEGMWSMWEDTEHDVDGLITFITVVSRWPKCPSTLVGPTASTLKRRKTFFEVRKAAIKFYVESFVDAFGRLPTPPVLSVR
ncbi:uncharacterized protein BXZ73DRAFT_46882, partial [Epithele typhae]|uniref:uncharacterized protein n=1 Tax=Epithele typhae TaxID=378194 RepID=UPI002007AAF5